MNLFKFENFPKYDEEPTCPGLGVSITGLYKKGNWIKRIEFENEIPPAITERVNEYY